MKLTVNNRSRFPKAFKTRDGIKTVPPGEKATFPDAYALNEATIAALEADKVKIAVGETDASNGDEYEDMSVEDLEQLATDSGVMPEKGSGKNGAVLKADIIAALRAA